MDAIIVEKIMMMSTKYSIVTKSSKEKPEYICIYGKTEGNLKAGDTLKVEGNENLICEIVYFPSIRRSPYIEGSIDILIKPLRYDKLKVELVKVSEELVGKKLIKCI
ncbi:MAG: hypothetical protein N3B21_14070 [Clostridia bacterium]|nr:hypothetical protein [Clostridia bacterium]